MHLEINFNKLLRERKWISKKSLRFQGSDLRIIERSEKISNTQVKLWHQQSDLFANYFSHKTKLHFCLFLCLFLNFSFTIIFRSVRTTTNTYIFSLALTDFFSGAFGKLNISILVRNTGYGIRIHYIAKPQNTFGFWLLETRLNCLNTFSEMLVKC